MHTPTPEQTIDALRVQSPAAHAGTMGVITDAIRAGQWGAAADMLQRVSMQSARTAPSWSKFVRELAQDCARFASF